MNGDNDGPIDGSFATGMRGRVQQLRCDLSRTKKRSDQEQSDGPDTDYQRSGGSDDGRFADERKKVERSRIFAS